MVAKFEKCYRKQVVKLKKLIENGHKIEKLEKSEGKIGVEIEKLEKYNGNQAAKWKIGIKV